MVVSCIADCLVLSMFSTHIEGHKRGKDDERTRARKKSSSREQRKPDAARRGSEGSSGMKGMGKLGPRGSRL